MNTLTLSAIAWASLTTPVCIAAGIGCMRCARLLLIARDDAAHWRQERDQISGELASAKMDKVGLNIANVQLEEQARLERDLRIDTEDQLRRIERQRSETTRKGNLTRSAKRKALIAETTAAIARSNASEARKPRLAA